MFLSTRNEHPNPQAYVQKIPKPTEGAYLRIHQPPFPIIDWCHVQEIIDKGQGEQSKLILFDCPQVIFFGFMDGFRCVSYSRIAVIIYQDF